MGPSFIGNIVVFIAVIALAFVIAYVLKLLYRCLITYSKKHDSDESA